MGGILAFDGLWYLYVFVSVCDSSLYRSGMSCAHPGKDLSFFEEDRYISINSFHVFVDREVTHTLNVFTRTSFLVVQRDRESERSKEESEGERMHRQSAKIRS